MRVLFVLLIASLTVSDVFGLEMSLAPGLSVKNAILYLIVFTMFFRTALSGLPRMRLPSVMIPFILLVGYSMVSWVVTSKVMHYTGYHPFDSLILLKNRMVDPAIMLFAVFYGITRPSDADFLFKCVIGAVGFASLATIADASGVVHLGMRMGDSGAEEGRVFGAFGHANETGALTVCVLPALIAVAFVEKGMRRMAWGVAALATFLVLLMTVSRGAFVGLAVGGGWAAYLCRRYIPMQRFIAFGFGALMLGVLAIFVASAVDPQFGGTIVERLMGQSRSLDVGEVSSGRTAIWAEAFAMMLEHPITLLSGFGWDSYPSMPFRYAPHNYYLNMLFNLGSVALVLFWIIIARSVITAHRAVPEADREHGTYLLGFVFGMMSLAIALIFADLFRPWPYIWLFTGLALRMAVFVTDPVPQPAPAQPGRPLIGAPMPPARGILTSTRRPGAA